MSLLQSLPGIATPVSDVTKALAQMWQGDSAAGAAAPSEFRASQMNLVLHFGLSTSEAEGLATFEKAVAFSQRYPCRIIVLCPTDEKTANSGEPLQGKLYSQCFIGTGHGEMSCCEALMLGYRPSESRFLEDQVSIWLESDLPTYHWFHRVPGHRIESQYLGFAKTCRRVIYDSGIDGYELHTLLWPRPEILHDLAWARLLPLRQSLGQFLSAFEPRLLVENLSEIVTWYAPGRRGEAENLVCWQYGGLMGCFKAAEVPYPKNAAAPLPDVDPNAGDTAGDFDSHGEAPATGALQRKSHAPQPLIPYRVEALPSDSPESIRIEWRYTDASRKSLHFTFNAQSGEGCIHARLTEEPITYPLHIKSLKPEEELSEALFF